MDFSWALNQLKDGKRVCREGWNGKGMFIFLTVGRHVINTHDRSFIYFTGEDVVLRPHIDMKDAQGCYISGWLASQTDLLSDDWRLAP